MPPTGDTPRPDVLKAMQGIALPERRGESAPTTQNIGDVGASLHAVYTEAPNEATKQTEITFDTRGALAPLHTLKHDLQDAVREKKVSLVTEVALRADRAQAAEEIVKDIRPSSMGKIVLIGTVLTMSVLLLGSVGFIMYDRAQVAPASAQSGLIFSEQSLAFSISDLTPVAIKGQLDTVRREAALPLGALVSLVPMVDEATLEGTTAARKATTEEFLRSLGITADPSLYRALDTTPYIGFHSTDINSPIMLFLVNDYDVAFRAMVEWEARMSEDLAPPFQMVNMRMRNADETITLRTFEDMVERNYDVRALRDDAGTIGLFYSFLNPRVLVISERISTLREVLSRLRAEGKI